MNDPKLFPRVTEILKPRIPTRWFDEQSAIRGTLVHQMCAMHCHGILDWESIDERLKGYVISFCKGIEAMGYLPVYNELSVVNYARKYRGTLDLFGIHPKLDLLLLDLKTGVPDDWHRLQTAAYAYGMSDRVPIPNLIKRGTLYLDKHGKTAKFKLHDGRYDFDEFLELRKNHG